MSRRQTRASLAAAQSLLETFNALSKVDDACVKLEQDAVRIKEDIEDTPYTMSDIGVRITRSSSVFHQVRQKESRTSVAIKQEIAESPRLTRSVTAVPKVKRKPAKSVKTKAPPRGPPANWQKVYDAVMEMRKARNAPVDTMGCESLAASHATARDRRFQTLIALMLSSQTKDTTNAVAIRNLQTQLPWPGLCLESILAVEPAKLNEMIYVVGFHNTKTRHIKAAALLLRDNFGGEVPDTLEGLLSLPGVGPKMAYLCLAAAWGRVEGIGVDVHVHRITNLWKWHKTTTPEETRACLEAWLPREKWHEINHLLVGFGQTICTPVARKCGDCSLSASGLCPSSITQGKGRKRLHESSDSDS